jgi:hypothetical protein
VGFEVILLLRCLERTVELAQTGSLQQLGLSNGNIRIDDEMALNDFGDFLLTDSSRRTI